MKLLRLTIRLARIHFVLFGCLLYLVGYQLAVLGGATADLGKGAFGYLILGLAHLSVSFSNDYFDRHSDRHSPKTAFSGGSKVLIEHPELEGFALRIAVGLLILSIMGTAVFTFTYSYSPWFLAFGVVGALTGWFYSAPPLKLAYRGLGELTTMLAVGVLMPGIGYFTASGFLDSLFLAFVFPFSCYGLFFILTVELPDVESDVRVHKTNIPATWGRKAATAITVAATILGVLSLAIIQVSGLLQEKLDLKLIIVLAIVPVIAALTVFQRSSSKQEFAIRQMKVNMASMILFLGCVNLSFLIQVLF